MNRRYHASSEKFVSDINNVNELKREKITKTMTNIDSLINKKFKLNSAFDHKGSKNFLNSKKIALQQIILDDEVSTDIDPKDDNSKQKKNSSKNKNFCGKSLIEEERNSINSNSPTVMKNSLKKKKDGKNEYFSNFYGSSPNNKKYLSSKKMSKNIPHKFYSNQELKMLEDEEIKKIKSIKKDKKKAKSKSKKNNNANENISFMEKNDSFIIDIIAQLK